MPRLGHKKSRNGCRQCKARHVKCDENKPCSSCARHGVQCSLIEWDPNAPPPQPIKREPTTSRKNSKTLSSIPERPRKSSLQTSSTSLPIDLVLNPSSTPTPGSSDASSPFSQHDTYPFLSKFAHRVNTNHSDYWLRDLELMHHWSIEQYYYMATRENVRTFWRVEAPKLAVNYPFLLHELLAISALHKAYLNPGQRLSYYALGSYHQDVAIRELRKSLPILGPENSGAMFATSAVISLSAFASTGLAAHDESTGVRSPIEDLIDIFALLQGMHGIISQYNQYVYGGPFGGLLAETPKEETEPEAPMLLAMSAHLPALKDFLESQPLEPPIRAEAILAFSSLRQCLDFANSAPSHTRELRFLFLWPNQLNQTFHNLIKMREPAAMVILAYYAVAFQSGNGFYWFLDGWAQKIMRAIAEALSDQPKWQPIFHWPWDTIMGAHDRFQSDRNPLDDKHALSQPPPASA